MTFGNNFGLHIIQYPSGRFGYVGSVPTALATLVPATMDDIRAGRAFTGEDGKTMTWKFPVFKTREAAVAFAQEHGFTVR